MKCEICNKEIQIERFICKKLVCRLCFLKLRKGHRIYKIEGFTKVNKKLFKKITKRRGRLNDRGHSYQSEVDLRG